MIHEVLLSDGEVHTDFMQSPSYTVNGSNKSCIFVKIYHHIEFHSLTFMDISITPISKRSHGHHDGQKWKWSILQLQDVHTKFHENWSSGFQS